MNRLFFFLVIFGCFANAQHQDKVDFIHADVYIRPIPAEKKVVGTVAYKFNVLSDVDSIFLDAKQMKFGYVSLDDKIVKYDKTDKIIVFRQNFKANESHTLGIGFEARPKQTVYFMASRSTGTVPVQSATLDTVVNENFRTKAVNQIWTQGQGKYTSHWLPSFDAMEEKVEFDLTIAAPNDFTVITNGQNLVTSNRNNQKITEWNYDMQNPMSSYLLAFVIGHYDKQELISKSGVPIENYYYTYDSLKVEPTYRYTKRIFDFLEEEIGVPYPWQNYKQVPVHDFLYAGMENTTTTVFSDAYMIDSTGFNDKNYVNINAHELAHQWFGNLVTEKNGNHHWLHEGFATYYAYLAEQQIFGDDHFYWKLHSTLKQLQQQTESGDGQSLLDSKANSLTFYEKGAWALFVLNDLVGDNAFKKGVKNYLEKFQFKNATVGDFLKEIQIASENDLSSFRTVWLENTDFPLDSAMKVLMKNCASIRLLSEMEKSMVDLQNDDIDYSYYWNETNSIHLQKHIIENYRSSISEGIYEMAFESDTVPVRQALLDGRDLPKFLNQERLESFLEDDSYLTKESALFRLWQAYPEDRGKYLDMTKDLIGLPNKNIRIMWLALAMLSEDYNAIKTKEYFDELSSYTGSEYSFDIRQNAFFYLKEAFGLNDESLTSLIKATNHHTWQFKKFARNLLDDLLKDSDYKERLQKLVLKMNSKESGYLQSKLNNE